MTTNRTVLIIDDEESIRRSLMGVLKDEGYQVKLAGSGPDGIDVLRGERVDAILLDIWMPEMDGLEVLKIIKAEWPDQIVIMMSGHGTIETAVRATKMGALDFIEKPLSLERLLLILHNAWSIQDLARENQALRARVQKGKVLIGESAALRQLRDLIQRVAPSTGSILITGENGTGKELVAQSIHAASTRHQKPFVEVNCAAIPEELIESELFGHEKGAFTGATQLRRGKFDLAHQGTLFLDEIADMSLKTQAKVLRILQEQKFERVGGTQTISVDVRILAATNKDLKAEIQKGNFREDLYYRLKVIPIIVPPLRERSEDIDLLVPFFSQEFAVQNNRKRRAFSVESMKILRAYGWPGNVRELKNLVERILILTRESDDGKEVGVGELLEQFKDEASSLHLEGAVNDLFGAEPLQSVTNLRDARASFEKDYILKALKENDGNISKTAIVLGIERSYLHRKIKSFGIEVESI